MRILLSAAIAASFGLPAARADDITSALDHAPIGVMGDHLHGAGEIMFSYRAMRMQMEGNLIGTDEVDPDTIVTTVPAPFAPTDTLRVVPLEMSMTMHMGGVMYAPTDGLTLMAMANYVTKEMDHVTYRGMMGTEVLGNFTTEVSEWGDLSATALVRLYEREHLKAHIGLGVSVPTGRLTLRDTVLTPMGTRAEMRLPYPMQTGSGTFDFLPSLTVTNVTHDARFGGGVQYSGTIRGEENDQGYALGDRHLLTGWGAYAPDPRISFSLRGIVSHSGDIEGRDPRIAGPVQTADPNNIGGERADIAVGVNLLGIGGVIDGYRLAGEVVVPFYQDLNGPQLETDWTATLGVQKAF